MREKYSPNVERCRILAGRMGTPPGERCGAFTVRSPVIGQDMVVVVGDGSDWQEIGLKLPAWEHVSVSLKNRCPTWDEMCYVKKLFFEDEECVVQFHPPESEYVRHHPYALHLWRVVGQEFPRPPAECVGPKNDGSSAS